jgi:hypothetical protein
MHSHDAGGNAKYEMTDVKAKLVVYAGIFCFSLCLFSFVLGFFILKYFTDGRPSISKFEAPKVTTGQSQWDTSFRLQADLAGEYNAFADKQLRKLKEFDVVSESPNIYQVPIETAIGWVAEEGLPNFDNLPAVQQAETQK